MKKETKRMAIIAGCSEIWSETYHITQKVKALKTDISELSINEDFDNLYNALNDAMSIANHFTVITRKGELQLKDDEETAEETEEK